MTERLLALKNISKTYPGVVAADKVSMDFNPGEVVGLVGKNGAGKSTIIRMIAGVEQPDHGIISVNGKPFAFLTTQDATDLGLAFVHQELNDVPMLSIAENISLGLGYPKHLGFWMNKRALNDRASHVLKQIHMGLDPSRKVATLSVAERRMVMIARALVTNSKLIIMDEPTASLTDREIDELHMVIRKLKSDGVCIVYVSHRLQEIMELTDRVIVMRDGQVVAGKNTNMLNEGELISMIVGHDINSKSSSEKSGQSEKSNKNILLEVRNIDPFNIGEEFSFNIKHGEILGLSGLAGSGRTEAARQIVGADYRPCIQHIVKSEPCSIHNPADALKHGIALVPEDRRNEGALLNFSVDHNITLSSLKQTRKFENLPFPSSSAEKDWAARLIEKLHIKTPSGDQIVAGLSGGNQQKVVLARCLAANVNVLVLDEPTHGIDVESKEEIYELVRQLADAGNAIILISSELQELVRLVDRTLVLCEGRLVGELAGDKLTEHNILELCFQADRHVA